MGRLAEYNWKNKLILVVDDDRASSLLLEVLISKTGAKIIFASNGEKAIEIFLNTKGIDLILMDIKMNGMSGIDATKVIRGYDRDVPIIAQTACVVSGDRELCLKSGCNEYISKPIIAEDLMKLMNSFLDSSIVRRSSPTLFSKN